MMKSLQLCLRPVEKRLTGSNMDDSLEVRKNQRLQVELMVALELSKLGGDIVKAMEGCMKTGTYTPPDSKAWARKIIAIVNEHSL
jgi:hypothetical protein